MTRNDWLKRLPNASEDFLRRNASDGGNLSSVGTRKTPVVERNSRHGAVGKVSVQKRTGDRFLVRVTAFRHRLIDEDNLCEKFHVDLCRYAGILPSDAAGRASIKATQEKIGSQEPERVEIVISRVVETGVKQLSLDESQRAS